MLYFLSFHMSYPTQACVCIPVPDVIDTSLSYSTIRSSTNFLKLSKNLFNSNFLNYLTFPKLQWITEYIKLLHHQLHSYKIYKAWIKVKTKYKDFCSLYSKYKSLTLYYSQVKLTVQKPRTNHIVCQLFLFANWILIYPEERMWT